MGWNLADAFGLVAQISLGFDELAPKTPYRLFRRLYAFSPGSRKSQILLLLSYLFFYVGW